MRVSSQHNPLLLFAIEFPLIIAYSDCTTSTCILQVNHRAFAFKLELIKPLGGFENRVSPTNVLMTVNGQRLQKEYASRWELVDNTTVPIALEMEKTCRLIVLFSISS
jgi:hypothetical protein